ncbi:MULTISPECIES: ribosome maturation factor RimM [Helicobacter]|uniref:ribosome maturation factor RimM n=1 Tax=Helicobacter TaxID=209 RepID=UPI000EAE217F|nr:MULTISPECIES: ribosome maturation factor RimM [Helicobacter]
MCFKPEDLVVVGHLGRAVGLKGGIKLILEGDFTQCLQTGVRVYVYSPTPHSPPPTPLVVAHYQAQKALIFFEEIQSLEQARGFACWILAMSKTDSLRLCPLQEGEFLYFQLVGLQIIEAQEVLGVVKRIERLANTDYLFVQGIHKLFLIPYIETYIKGVDLSARCIYTTHARGLLEES